MAGAGDPEAVAALYVITLLQRPASVFEFTFRGQLVITGGVLIVTGEDVAIV